MLHRYELAALWTIQARIDDVFDVLNDTESYARWWSAVFLRVEEWSENGVRFGRIHSRGWLPYRLNWVGRQTLIDRPHTLEMTVSGDFNGLGRWRLEQHGETAHVHFLFSVDADKPLLRYLSPLLKPIFKANHGWAMRQGLTGLLGELERRRSQIAS